MCRLSWQARPPNKHSNFSVLLFVLLFEVERILLMHRRFNNAAHLLLLSSLACVCVYQVS